MAYEIVTTMLNENSCEITFTMIMEYKIIRLESQQHVTMDINKRVAKLEEDMAYLNTFSIPTIIRV